MPGKRHSHPPRKRQRHPKTPTRRDGFQPSPRRPRPQSPPLFRRLALTFLLALAPTLTFSQSRIAFKTEGRGTRYGVLSLAGGSISIQVDDDAKSLSLAPADLVSAEFHSPKHDRFPGTGTGTGTALDPGSPGRSDALAAPWKHGTVGRLRSRASARNGSRNGDGNGDGNGGGDGGGDGGATFRLITAAPAEGETFRSFSMAYREAPENGHITARVTKIGHGDHRSRAGVIIRDGLGRDAGNFTLVIHPAHGASFRAWRSISKGYSDTESGRDIHPPYWVRLVHDRGKISGLVSPDGSFWTLIREIDESAILGKPRNGEKEVTRLFGLIATSASAESPWAASFDHVSLGPLDEIAAASAGTHRVYLCDGSKIRGPVSSSESGKLLRIGAPWNRTLPALYAARIDFFYPRISAKEKRLASSRPGVLLSGGDFIEAAFVSLHSGRLKVQSPLLGLREFAPGSSADAVVIRKPDPEPKRRATFKVETVDGQIFFAKSFEISDGHFVFDSHFLGKHHFPPAALRRITRTDLL